MNFKKNDTNSTSQQQWCSCEHCMANYYNNSGFCPVGITNDQEPHVSSAELLGLSNVPPHDRQSDMYNAFTDRNRINPALHKIMAPSGSYSPSHGSHFLSENLSSPPKHHGDPRHCSPGEPTKFVGHSVGQRQRQRQAPLIKKKVSFWGDIEGSRKPLPRKIVIFSKNNLIHQSAQISYV